MPAWTSVHGREDWHSAGQELRHTYAHTHIPTGWTQATASLMGANQAQQDALFEMRWCVDVSACGPQTALCLCVILDVL